MGSNDLKSSLEKQRLGPPLNIQMLKIWRLSATPWNPIAIRLNLVTTFNKCKIYFQVSVVILIQENSFECEEDFESECNISKSYKRIRPDGN